MASSNPMRERIRSLGLLGLFGASIAIWWHPLAADMKLALSSDAHTHILLILPLSIALIYSQAREFQFTREPGLWPGLIILTRSAGLTRFHNVGRLACLPLPAVA